MKTMQEMNTREFLRFARRQARASFKGIAITSTATASAVPANLDDDLRFAMLADRVTMEDGSEMVRSEKVLPFNRKALMNPPRKKESEPVGDCSIIRIGRPGSRERVEAYARWNELNPNASLFIGMED